MMSGSFACGSRDDGKGIDPDFLTAKGRAGHLGLAGMHERAELIGGKLTRLECAGFRHGDRVQHSGDRAYAHTARIWPCVA